MIANFALNGTKIFAMNTKQELCVLHPVSLKILTKGRISETSNNNFIVTSIIQLTDQVIVLGSFIDKADCYFGLALKIISGEFRKGFSIDKVQTIFFDNFLFFQESLPIFKFIYDDIQ